MRARTRTRIGIALATAILLGAGGVALRSVVPPDRSNAASTPTVSASAPDETPESADPNYEVSDDPYSVDSGNSIAEHNRTARSMGDFFDDTIAGIRVDRHYSSGCADERAMTESDLRKHRMPTPEEIPRGWKVSEKTGWMCGDRARSVGRIVKLDDFIAFGIGRLYDNNVLAARAGEKLVSEGTIQGRPAVLIKPMSRQGSGNSWIAFKDGDDLIVFKGVYVRFDILRRAAESMPL